MKLNDAIKRLRKLVSPSAPLESQSNQPLFLFLCGGAIDDPRYICRADTEDYISRCEGLSHIYPIKPEVLLGKHAEIIEGMNLLELEAVIAELSDAILLFDESYGSVCELGAFALSQPMREIITVAVPRKYEGNQSFIVTGPVRHVEQCNKELSGVIYLDIECPFSSSELEKYLFTLTGKVQRERTRKPNTNSSKVDIGAFCRECLDLISIFSPICDIDLFYIYKTFKQFSRFDFYMKTLNGVPRSFSYKVVLAYLSAAGLIDYDSKSGRIEMRGVVPRYFMFDESNRDKVQAIRARVLLDKVRTRDGEFDGFAGANGL